MNLDVSGRQYNVKFVSTKKENDKGHEVRHTLCFISTINEGKSGAERYSRVTTGLAVQNVKDRDYKAAGQKIALTKALAKSSFTKGEKFLFWNEFFNEKNGIVHVG